MKQALRIGIGGLVAVLLSAATWAAPLPGFALAGQTDHFLYYSRDGLKVDVSRSEKFLARIEKTLDCKVTTRGEYYRYGYPEQIAVTTGHYAAGLTDTRGARIHTTEAYHPHEIVHWVSAQLGNPGSFFQEGLAVALSGDGKWRGSKLDDVARRTLARVSIADLVHGFEQVDPEASYPVAGAFVAHLVSSEGIDAVSRFFRQSGHSGDPSVAFQAVFGLSFDTAASQWAAAL